mgnify:FL=1
MMIQKILPYDLYANTTGTARYHRVGNILNQTLDPDSQHPRALDCNTQPVYTSTLKRAHTCIDTDTTTSITHLESLNEITFDLHRFCNEVHFLQVGSTAVRSAFVEAFVSNQLALSHTQLRSELIEILSLSHHTEPPLCLSHTFRMKLISVYSDIGDELFDTPTSIVKHLDTTKHLYKFGEMIEV